MTDGSFVDAVALLAKNAQGPHREKIGEYEFSSSSLVRLDTDPLRPEPLVFNGLTGFAQYVNAEPEATAALIHVVSPTEVQAVGKLGGHDKDKRRCYAKAVVTPTTAGFQFNEFHSMGDLNIFLKTCFAQKGGDIQDLRKFCAGVRSAAEKVSADDGVSQTVQAKAGIAAISSVPVNNPWSLAPWRTFVEVTQPESDYVLRFDQGSFEGPEAV